LSLPVQRDLRALVAQMIETRALNLALQDPELARALGYVGQEPPPPRAEGEESWRWVEAGVPPLLPAPPPRPQRWLERKIYMARFLGRMRRGGR
jgi:hypothetical protein